jgi:F-type H+-transporting ATPase subunit a
MAGHMLLSILSGLTYTIMTSGFVFFILALLPLAFIILFSILEFAIAFIQAYVFVVLTCSYLKDVIYLH